MLTTKQKLDYYISLKICLGETKKKKYTLAGSHREDKKLIKVYDDMKLPHCKIIDEHSACNQSIITKCWLAT
jgi:hypothetical protein